MGEDVAQTGYFSILRWRSDATRDEARNVAVILVEAEGQFGVVRAAPPSAISPRLQEQGLLDAMVVSLEKRLAGSDRPNVIELRKMQQSMQHSLYLTEPQLVAVLDVDTTAGALYKAFIAPRRAPSRRLTKGAVLDTVVNSLRRGGHNVGRSQYVGDFVFDLVVEQDRLVVGEVLSFATDAKNWIPTEHDAGHFLYALDRVDAEGFAVVQSPSEVSDSSAYRAFERVTRWLDREGVMYSEPGQLQQTGLLVAN